MGVPFAPQLPYFLKEFNAVIFVGKKRLPPFQQRTYDQNRTIPSGSNYFLKIDFSKRDQIFAVFFGGKAFHIKCMGIYENACKCMKIHGGI